MLVRKEPLVYIDKNDENKALYYIDNIHKKGRVHSYFVEKIWKYSLTGSGKVKKQRGYVFREETMPSADNPTGIRYRISIIKCHMSNALLSQLLTQGEYEELLSRPIVFINRKCVWFTREECDDEVTSVIVLHYKDVIKEAEKRIASASAAVSNLKIEQSWSINGFGNDYKTENENKLVKFD